MKAAEIRAQLEDHKRKISDGLKSPDLAVLKALELSANVTISLFTGEIAFQLAMLNENLELARKPIDLHIRP